MFWIARQDCLNAKDGGAGALSFAGRFGLDGLGPAMRARKSSATSTGGVDAGGGDRARADGRYWGARARIALTPSTEAPAGGRQALLEPGLGWPPGQGAW